jgi:hypothetical protein
MKVVYKVYELAYNLGDQKLDTHLLDFYSKFDTKEEALDYISKRVSNSKLGFTILEVYVG